MIVTLSRFAPLVVTAAALLFSACADGSLDPNGVEGFPPGAGRSPGAPCRAADDPAGPCDQDLSGADFVDLVCLSGTCVVDCAAGGDFLCASVVASFLTCSAAAGDVCVRACGAPGDTCPTDFSCYAPDDACLPTGSFPTSPCRPDAASPCDALGGAPMACVADVCAVACADGGADLCRTVDARLTCSAAAGDVCVYDCAAGCPDGFSCFASEAACLPTGAFPGSPCVAGPLGSEPSCGALTNAADPGAPVAMACVADTCVVPCDASAGSSGDALCSAIDTTLACSAAAGACVPRCNNGACPDGFSCFPNEDRCLPTGSFPGSPCPEGGACAALEADGPDGPIAMSCVQATCVVPCAAGAAGDALCASVDASLGCSAAAGGCVPRCAAGACPTGFSCFASEDRCLPTGAFPGSPCRTDVADPCDQDLRGHPDLDLRCQAGTCLVDCEEGGDFVCGRADPGLTCAAAAGDVCLPRCDKDAGCPAGLACFASEDACLPLGSFPGSPCPEVGAVNACATLPGGVPMRCAAPDPARGPLCLAECATGGTATCQAIDAGLSCNATSATDALCLPNGAFPGSLCRDAAASTPCDRDLAGHADVDLACIAGTCQLDCTTGGATACGLMALGQGLPAAALTCVDAGAVGRFCGQAGCASGGAACPAYYHCDPSLDACLPYLPVHIVHTNDLHTHFDGVGPAGAASEGGYARLASVVRAAQQRGQTRGGLTLTLDGGDFTMGTLFSLLQGTVEFETLRYLAYDATTVGNHELDWGPGALAAMLARDTGTAPILPQVIAAVLGCGVGTGGCPALQPVPVVASNLRFDATDAGDDALALLYDADGTLPTADAPLERFVVIERAGLKVGVFGLLGRAAAEVTPGKAPVTFEDPIATAAAMVAELRGPPWSVDLVVALSHAGSAPAPWRDEDEVLAEAVPGIDVIISGHTHQEVAAKALGGAWLVQAGSYGRKVGELSLGWPLVPWGPAAGRIDRALGSHRLWAVGAGNAADPVLAAARTQYINQINGIFAAAGLTYATALGALDRDWRPAPLAESALGDLVADAVRQRVTAAVAATADTRAVDLAVVANGTVRDGLVRHAGQVSSAVTFADVFAVAPLGASPTAPTVPGWPLVEFYVDGAGLAQALEVGVTLGWLRGDDFWLNVSGVRFVWDPDGAPFRRVRGIWLDPSGAADVCNAATNLLDASGQPKNPAFRYRIAGNLYAAGFLGQLGALTGGALSVVPRDAAGAAVDPAARTVAGGVWGAQLREWQALVDHVAARASQAGGTLPVPAGGRVLDVEAQAALCGPTP